MLPALVDSMHSSPGKEAETNEIVPCEQCYEEDNRSLVVGCDQREPLRGAADTGNASFPLLGFCAYLVSHPVI